jgi:hypothetical protein
VNDNDLTTIIDTYTPSPVDVADSPAAADKPNPVRVLRSIECDSLSRMSRLTFQYGLRDDTEIVIRISANSGNGMFSDDWVRADDVLNVLRSPDNQEAISSLAFRPLYVGKSVNTPSFLMAALRHEEVITTHPTLRRAYQVLAVSAYEDRVRSLPASGPQTSGDEERPMAKTEVAESIDKPTGKSAAAPARKTPGKASKKAG